MITGPLINLLNSDSPRSTGILLSARVAEACNGNGWKLRAPRSDAALSLHTHLTTIPVPSDVTAEDAPGLFVDLFVDGTNCKVFSTSKT